MKSLRSFIAETNGSATVEFVIWVPLFAFLLMLTVNASFAFMDLTLMQNAARDGARGMAAGDFGPNAVEQMVKAQLPGGNYDVDFKCSTPTYACVSVSRDADEMLPFRNFLGVGNLLGKTFGVTMKIRYEPGVYDAIVSSGA